MIDYEELKDRIEMLEIMVNDLRWRMNVVCNTLTLEDEEPQECEHEPDLSEEARWLAYMDDRMPNKCNKCGLYYRPEKPKECEHEVDYILTKDTLPPTHSYHCKKCGEFYRPEEPQECEHEKGMVSRNSSIEWKCTKCGEFFR